MTPDPAAERWRRSIGAALQAHAAAREALDQTVRDAVTAGVTKKAAAAALGITDRTRVYAILDRTPPPPSPPPLTAVVFLPPSLTVAAQPVHEALWTRGWATISDADATCHLAAGGALVIACLPHRTGMRVGALPRTPTPTPANLPAALTAERRIQATDVVPAAIAAAVHAVVQDIRDRSG